MNLVTTVAELGRQLGLMRHPSAANRGESSAGDQLVCSVQLAAGPPQLSGSPCVPLLGPAASGCPHLSQESMDSSLVRSHGTGPLGPWQARWDQTMGIAKREAWVDSGTASRSLGQISKPFCASVSKSITWGSPHGLL